MRIILWGLAKRLGPVSKWLHVLVLDRGYWGAQYLLDLNRHYGIDLVTRAQHEDLAVVQDLEGLVSDSQTKWQSWQETHSRRGRIQVQGVGVEGLDLVDAHEQVLGEMNAVVADEYDLEGRRLRDEKGQERPRFHYVTPLPTAARPHRIRQYYRQRWGIENEGFRELTQTWALDRLAGRRFNALNSRTAFVLMLYNAERLLQMKHPGPWQQERQRRRAWGEQALIGGLSVATYTEEGRLGLFTPGQYGDLIAERERTRLVATLREALRRGEDLERAIQRLTSLPPRQA